MDNPNDEYETEHNLQAALGFLAGILIGSLAGAGTMLLLAPQSGKRTRDQIQRKGLELRDQASDTIEDAMAQGRYLSKGVQKKAEKIQQRGQDLLDEQKERWSAVVEAGQKAVKGTA